MNDHKEERMKSTEYLNSAIKLTLMSKGDFSQITHRDLKQIETELTPILQICEIINQTDDLKEIVQTTRNIRPRFDKWYSQIHEAHKSSKQPEEDMVDLAKSLGKGIYHDPNEGRIKLYNDLDPTKMFNWKEDFLKNAIITLENFYNKLQNLNETEHKMLKNFKGLMGLRLRIDVAQLLSLLQDAANVLDSLFPNVRKLDPKGENIFEDREH